MKGLNKKYIATQRIKHKGGNPYGWTAKVGDVIESSEGQWVVTKQGESHSEIKRIPESEGVCIDIWWELE